VLYYRSKGREGCVEKMGKLERWGWEWCVSMNDGDVGGAYISCADFDIYFVLVI
jgi:hypothetical protein